MLQVVYLPEWRVVQAENDFGRGARPDLLECDVGGCLYEQDVCPLCFQRFAEKVGISGSRNPFGVGQRTDVEDFSQFFGKQFRIRLPGIEKYSEAVFGKEAAQVAGYDFGAACRNV